MAATSLFPRELTARSQWCLWRIEPDRKGRPTKVPYRPDGRKAASDDPATWSAFAAVSEVLQGQPERYRGVGFFFAADDPVCGVDLDASLDAEGNPLPWAAEIVARFHNTYQARSVSGYGLHILCLAMLPAKGKNFFVPNAPTDAIGKRAQIGVFDRGRFFALTGEIYRESRLELAEHQQTIEWLLDLVQRRRRRSKSSQQQGELSDSEVIERARQSRNGSKFAQLWSGLWERLYGSQSEADLALCCILAFWCGPNPSRIDALFRQSGLAREKWSEREDYRERTIQAALEQTKEFYRPTKGNSLPASAAAFPSGRPEPDTLPEICVGARQLPAITADVLAAVQAANIPPELFVRSGRMVAVIRDERNRHVIAEVTESGLRGRIARSGFYYKLNKNQERIECTPPLDVVRDILALPPGIWKFPPLEALIETPFLRMDGTICSTPGYDPATYLFYAPTPGFRLPEIPQDHMIDDVEAMLDLIDSAIGDFPFVDAASKANAIASMLTPVVRPAIDSPTPLALYDAPQAGTGKSLLAEVVAIIATGRAAETFSAPTDPEEWRKKITTALSSGTGVVVIDNVNYRLDSDALCSAITSITISDRIFRTFERIVLPVKCAWIATGNNVQLGGDMPRRCYWIRLDAKQSKPFNRTGFKHENLRAWVTEHRGDLVTALLILARHWFLHDQPKPKNMRPLGSFESWCNVVGGILEHARVEGFLGNAEVMFEQADPDGVQWEAFFLVLAEVFGDEPFRTADVFERLGTSGTVGAPGEKRLREALPDFVAEAADRTGGFFQRRLGKCFAERVGRRFGESQVFLERADEDRKAKVQRWRVAKP